MSLLIETPGCERCSICRSATDKPGFLVEDDQRVRKFVCSTHLTELLRVMLAPLKAIAIEA